MNMNGYAYLIVFAAVVLVSEASDCCKSYTNPITREHVDGKFCNAYCCLFSSKGIYDCCDDVNKQAPAIMRDDDCSDWLKEHIWVPIVGSILFLVILIALCTCCCCCGCCACCRKGQSHAVIVTGGGLPSSVVVASHQQQQMSPPTNAAHYGYDQK